MIQASLRIYAVRDEKTMTINEGTIAEIVRRRDSNTVYEIIRSLVRNLNDRTNELKGLRTILEKLRKSFMQVEADRARIETLAHELIELCEQEGLSQKANEVARRNGGLRPTENDGSEITIDLA